MDFPSQKVSLTGQGCPWHDVIMFAWQETVTLVVDERLIEVSSAALITASDVLKTMLESDFLERNTGQIALCGKSYEAAKFMATYVSSKDHVPIPGNFSECTP